MKAENKAGCRRMRQPFWNMLSLNTLENPDYTRMSRCSPSPETATDALSSISFSASPVASAVSRTFDNEATPMLELIRLVDMEKDNAAISIIITSVNGIYLAAFRLESKQIHSK